MNFQVKEMYYHKKESYIVIMNTALDYPKDTYIQYRKVGTFKYISDTFDSNSVFASELSYRGIYQGSIEATLAAYPEFNI